MKIKFNFKEADEQKGLFTKYHTLYKCVIAYNGKQYTFDYQCNKNYTMPNLEDCMRSLVLDADAYSNSNSLEDFCNEYCYENIAEGKKAYNACKRTYNALNRLFTSEELEELYIEVME